MPVRGLDIQRRAGTQLHVSLTGICSGFHGVRLLGQCDGLLCWDSAIHRLALGEAKSCSYLGSLSQLRVYERNVSVPALHESYPTFMYLENCQMETSVP